MTQRIVVMGVSGSGKSTVGAALAECLGLAFVDGDDLHPPANVARMAAGEPLADVDRWPWLVRIRDRLRDGDVVVACSALRRTYRDLLRGADGVRFVHLHLDPETVRERVGARTDHFMGPDMIDGQFAVLEPPGEDETDAVALDASEPVAGEVARAVAALDRPFAGPGARRPLVADGAPDRLITEAELAAHVTGLAELAVARGARRVLIVPPDHTRSHSRAGPITVGLDRALRDAGVEVGILPAVGTHAPMTAADVQLLFGDDVAVDRLLVHRWRDGLRPLGEIGADEVAALSGGRYAESVPVAVDEQLFAGWDLVISVGQVVPHEVIGMANFTKNLVVGLGGTPTIHRTHFLGAACDMETLMGRAVTPVRDVVDAAFDRFVAPVLDVLWVLTVVEAEVGGDVLRGLYAGFGSTADTGGAAFRVAAALSAQVNVERVAEPWARAACWLDPEEFRSTWLGNKAIYRTRAAMADGGELIVLAPGVTRFGEDDALDALIRRHGYRGTGATLAAVADDPELAANLGAAAHLIHGSSEGRFDVVYCTDPSTGGLTRAEVEGVGYRWRPLTDELAALGVDGSTTTGPRPDVDGIPFFHVRNPALGLWTADR